MFLLLAGCSKDTTPEQRQADQTLAKARDAYERKLYRESRQLLWQAFALDSMLTRPRQMAEETELLGRTYKYGAKLDSALLLFSRSVEHYKAVADKITARELILEIARLHKQMGEHHQAYEFLVESLRLAKLFKESDSVREIQWELMATCAALEYSAEEAELRNELLNAYISERNASGQGKVHLASGISALQREEPGRAAENFLSALALAEQSKDSLLAINALYHLAEANYASGKTPQAFEYYTEALKRSDVTSGAQNVRLEMLTRVGNIYLQKGTLSEAARFYRAALASAVTLGNKVLEGYLFIQLGHCETTDIATAARNFQSSLELFQGVGYSRGASYAHRSLGAQAEREKKLNDAIQHYQDAITLDEQTFALPGINDVFAECEKVSPVAMKSYDALVDLLLRLGRTEEAFGYIQRREGWSLFRQLVAQQVHARDTASNAQLTLSRNALALRIGAERQLEEMLQAGSMGQDLYKEAADQLAATRANLDRASADAYQQQPRMEQLLGVRALSVGEAQRLIPQGTVLVLPVPAKLSTYQLVVTPTKIAAQVSAMKGQQTIAMAQELNAQLKQRTELEDSSEIQKRKSESRIDDLSSSLYSVLIRPIEAEIAGASRLLVVLPEELAGVPLHALRKGVMRAAKGYVAERFVVRYLPATSALLFEGAREDAKLRVAGLGHSGATDWDVEYELRDIQAFFKDARLRFGQQATLGTLKSESADVMHLALELQANARVPSTASVLFSDGQSVKGTRSIPWGELLSLPAFPAVLVSDLGASGAKLHGSLATIFLMNGSGSVVLNSYPPLRRSKKYFGEVFYTALLSGAPVEVAVQKVQQEMIKNREYASPHIWAPYFVWGK